MEKAKKQKTQRKTKKQSTKRKFLGERGVLENSRKKAGKSKKIRAKRSCRKKSGFSARFVRKSKKIFSQISQPVLAVFGLIIGFAKSGLDRVLRLKSFVLNGSKKLAAKDSGKSIICGNIFKKKSSLEKRNFLTVFGGSSWFGTQSEEKFDFGQYIDNYKYRRDVLGKYYHVSRLSDLYFGLIRNNFSRILKKTGLICYRGVVVALALVIVYASTPNSLGAPKSVSVSTKSQWEQGETVGLSMTSREDALQLAPDGTWTARSWAPAPDTISVGSTSVLAGNYLYVARGYSDNDLYIYNIEMNQWTETIDLPQPAFYGCDAVYDGEDHIYFIFGGYSKKFYKFNIETKEWTALPDLLDTIFTGAGIEFDGTDVYVIRGQASTDFWRFDISENGWFNLAPTPATVTTGSNIVYGGDGYMYVTRGSSTATLYRYNISANSWEARANAPATITGEQKGVFHGGYVYFFRSGGNATFYRYNTSGNSWETLENAPATVNFTSLTLNADDGMIYAIRANGQQTLWKFDPSVGTSGQWVGPADFPGAVGTGGDLIWNGVSGAEGHLYAIRGGNTNSFYRFDIANNSWTSLANTLANMTAHTNGTYHDGIIYIPRGDNTTGNFYAYNTASDAWSSVGGAAPGTFGSGASAAYNASDGFVYVTRGNGQDDLFRHTIGGGWESRADIILPDGTQFNVNVGGNLKSDGTNLYLMVGDGETAFLKYDTAANSWSELARTPFSQYFGTDMTFYDGKFYALAGYYKDETWEYTISTNTWRKLPSNQLYTFGRGPYNGASIAYAGGDSFFATPGTALVDFWSYTLGAKNFVASGTYVSHEIDLSYVDSWISLTAVEDLPANTSAQYETRTSNDGESWSEWQAVFGGNIQSPERRYIQVKINLATSDGESTPTVHDFTISYNSEDIAPSNPNTISAFSQRIGGEEISEDISYRHAHPYFSWSGAQDPDSGIAGYYVYFGEDGGSDPETAGVFQSSSSYVANLAMETGDYFLRIKTKDNDGNVSDTAWDAFTYSYNGVSPFQSATKTSQEDFELGSTVDVSSSSVLGSMRLEGVDGFWDEVRLSTFPAGARHGAELALANGDLYALRGNNQSTFYHYDVSEDAWSALANTLETVGYGGALVEGPSGYLYASRGVNSPTFWRYDIDQNLWEAMSSAPKSFTYGSSLSFDGGRYIYALPGNEDAFYRYDTQNNLWTTLPNANFGNPNENDGQRTERGSDSAFDGTNAIYVMQGNYYNYFAKYSIANNEERGETANTWTVLSPLPIGSYLGGCLTYDPETNSIFALTGNYRQNFFKYDIDTDSWVQMPDVPASIEYGASLAALDGYIYALRGYNTTGFYRFNIEEESWDMPKQGFFGPNTTTSGTYFGYLYGTTMARDDQDNIYIVRGSYSDDFGVYSTETGEFKRLARTPVGIYNGGTLLFNEDENALYLTSGDIRTRRSAVVNNYFLKYLISSNTWEVLSSDPAPYQTTYGSSTVYDGSRYIYMTRGANSATWWRYDTSAVAGSRWSGTLPTTSGWVQGYGSNMVYKEVAGTDYIYSCRGNNYTTCFRYDVDAGTWSSIANAPAGIRYGGSLTDGQDGYLYLVRGNNTNDFYRYNISADNWETIDKIPAQVNYGGVGVFAGNRTWTTAGNGTNSYPDGIYSFLVASEENGIGFEKRGSYTSEAIDLTDVYRWANFSAVFSEPPRTSISIQTRTSSDGSDWSSWSALSEEEEFASGNYRYSIQSAPARYIQVKVDFSSSDQIYSPLFEEFTVNYYQDLEPPSNPTQVVGYDSLVMGTELAGNNWYNHSAPHFVWPEAEQEGGASDGIGGSGVIGYYVCFDTAAECSDPYVGGSFQEENSYTASSLVSGNDYRLLIKAVDDAQMIPAETFSAFTYRFDSTPPTNPSDISVTPTGYTASDSYSFLWQNDASDANSGLAKFQYRTGGDEEGTWFDIEDAGQVSLSLPNEEHPVGAYQSGRNWFYLRTVDNAGNVSSPISQEYYFSMDAPSPPRKLEVSPDYSETNEFSFSWEQPESFLGSASELTYHYSINALPNAYNTVETRLTFAGPGPFASQKGPNRFYICAMDEAKNIDYSLYAYVDFTADTSAPGPPVNIQIFDTSDRENQEYSIALKWSPPASMNEDNFEGYVIYRSDDNVNFSEVATTSGSAYVDTELESRLYYYYAKAKDSTNNVSIPSSTVSIVPTGRYTTPPTLVTEPSYTVKSYAATVKWATNRVASSFVEYGTSMSFGKTNGQVDSVTDHIVELNGLDAGTKYFYRVKYIDQDGNIGMSDVGIFETLPPPTISELVISDIGLSTATVSWKTNTDATCILKYGEGSFSNTIEEAYAGTGHIARLENLQSSTLYKLQVDAVDKDLNSFNSDEYSFTTLEQPVMSDFSVENKENVDSPTLVVKFNTSMPTTTLVKFRTGEGSFSNYLTNEYVTEHVAEISGLEPSVEYEIVASGFDANGIESTTQTAKIITRADSRPPGIVINRAVGKVVGRGKASHANMYIKVEVDETATVQVFYSGGIVLNNFEQSSNVSALNTYHLITIPVDPGQVYSYIVKAYDEAQNETITKPVTVVVEGSKDSASEIVLNTFSNKFSWISRLWIR